MRALETGYTLGDTEEGVWLGIVGNLRELGGEGCLTACHSFILRARRAASRLCTMASLAWLLQTEVAS